MNDTITLPRNIFEQIGTVMRRLVAKVEQTDKDAQAVRKEAVNLMQQVATLTDAEAKHVTHEAVQAGRSERNGAQVLLNLAERAEREGWSGPVDLSTNHDSYFVQAWEEQERAKKANI